MTRVLVVTLHTDEPQFDRCRSSIESQSSVDVDHVVLSGLPNVEAHRRCYRIIEDRASSFDLAVKVDADMVLATDGVLRSISDLLAHEPDVDHLSLAIDDFFTAAPMMGLQVFSPRATWIHGDEGLFVDPAPQVPGRRLDLWEPGFAVAAHAPNPSALQAFRFGVHRAQKAIQPDRSRLRGSQVIEQWRILVATWRAFDRGQDPRRGMAVSGAEAVLNGDLDMSGGYRSDAVEQAMSLVPGTAADMHRWLQPRWGRAWYRNLRRYRLLGLASTPRVAAAYTRMAMGVSGDRHGVRRLPRRSPLDTGT